MRRLKVILVSILVTVAIILAVDFFWVFKDYWWRWFFLVGFAGIGWYVRGYFILKSKTR